MPALLTRTSTGPWACSTSRIRERRVSRSVRSAGHGVGAQVGGEGLEGLGAAGDEREARPGIAFCMGQTLNIKRHKICRSTLSQTIAFATHSDIAACQRAIKHRTAGRAFVFRQHIARAMQQTLRIFILTQLIANTDQHIGIQTTPNRPPLASNTVALNVPSPRLASVTGQRPAIAPASAIRRVSVSLLCVA